jgi:monoamine oxidase
MDFDVAVVGAGAAGLAAARSLAARSLKVVLLEARERVGGRVWSQTIQGGAAPAELGAEFIHGPAAQTMALLREMGSIAVPAGGDSWTCSASGELRRDDRDVIALARRAFEGAQTLAEDQSADRFLRSLEQDAATRPMAQAARAFVEGFDAADPAVASARSIAGELRSGVDSAAARPPNGYRPMIEHMRAACANAGVETFLSTAVRRLSRRRGVVGIEVTGRANGTRTIRTRAAVVTLPVGVLRSGAVQFDPALPEAKRGGLQYLEMGHAVKVSLAFRTAFWEHLGRARYREAAAFRCEGGTFPVYWTRFPLRSTVITAWVGGPKAVALARASPAAIIERARDGFGALFGETELARNEFLGGAFHDWSSDPFAHGAYSYVRVGGASARAALGAPVDDALFFAGEATAGDGQGGTVNGALHSGERAAAELAASLGAGATHG